MDFDTLLSQIPKDLESAIKFVLDDFYSYLEHEINAYNDQERYDILQQYYLIFYTLLEDDGFEKGEPIPYPELILLDFGANEPHESSLMRKGIDNIYSINKRNIANKNAKNILAQTRLKLEKDFLYHFNEQEVGKVQDLINQLRKEITTKEIFEETHKRRILKRLETLQSEIHKKLSDLDHFWGLIGDAGVALGKFGKDARPFFDLIKDLTNEVWKAQARIEQIESTGVLPLLIDNSSNIAA